MAAVLSVFMTVLMWLVIVVGGVFFLLFGVGYLTSLSGGDLSTPVVSAAVDDLSANKLLTLLMSLLIFVPATVFICFQLRKILETLAMGDPFVPENASRLKRIAFTVAIMEFLRYVAISIVYLLPRSDDTFEGASVVPNFATWVAFVALFVLAQVFQEGARLRAEEKMTI